LDHDLVVDGRVVARKGALVTGTITEAVGSGKVQGRARMTLTLNSLEVSGETYPIASSAIGTEAQDTKSRDAKVIGGAAGVGAIIGAIAGGKKGAAIGGAIGGGAGAAGVMTTKGKEVEFDIEHRFSFRLERDVEIKLP
jgi:hypothetical protein